ncbi:hypothetical protein DN051_30035 [Streptomyces cadmiisoli]|uniref:Uncharacterized protein n=1 Tax=Streptomyces cadmiisoli TaxID=2184053 RepID=A0A2Z4J5A4_9ACTN|nr:hypothetical protein DN051_30035 [Streptomyces cadmiisoli]
MGARSGDVPALRWPAGASPRAVGMTDDGSTALRRDGANRLSAGPQDVEEREYRSATAEQGAAQPTQRGEE